MKTTIWKSKIRVTLCSLQPTERSPTLLARATYFSAMEVTSQPKIDTSQWFQSAPHGVNHVSRPSAKREAPHASNHSVLDTLQRTLRPLPSSPCHRSQKSRQASPIAQITISSVTVTQQDSQRCRSALVHFEPKTVKFSQHEQIFRFPIVEKNGSLYSKFSERSTNINPHRNSRRYRFPPANGTPADIRHAKIICLAQSKTFATTTHIAANGFFPIAASAELTFIVTSMQNDVAYSFAAVIRHPK